MKIIDVFKSFKPCQVDLKKPYIIAEAGVNHENSMDIAKRLIDEAKEGGAHAIKFQSYKASTLASKDSPAYWDTSKEPTTSQFELFKRHDKFWKKEFEELKKHCDSADIEFLSTPFDVESAEYLNDLVPAFKISSSDITNKPFIEYICQFNKPIIQSTGASFLSEIEEAVGWIDKFNVDLALLHCMLNYPTADINANLSVILTLRKKFSNFVIGYSDHTLPKDMKTIEIANMLGAQIIEKHFTHDKSLPGNDHYHAMDIEDLKLFFKNIDRTYDLLGSSDPGPRDQEIPARNNARRSLVAKCFIPAGKTIEYEDLTWKRPAHGVSPRNIEDIIGKRTLLEIEEDTVLKWHFFA